MIYSFQKRSNQCLQGNNIQNIYLPGSFRLQSQIEDK